MIEVPGVPRFVVAPHHCFACGTLNLRGLGLVIHVEPEAAWTETSLTRDFEGWDGVIHGGILATILDEVMAWALAGADNWGVTARMTVTFKRPVAVEVPIRAEGWLVRSRRRIADTAGHILDASSGEILALATGTYVAAGPDRKRELRERYGYVPLDRSAGPGAEAS
ncbi:MAG: PaaI family thioesterase [Chloroflexi bacterium]|nr:PaaI family thioesterase [Chloroflexota bacterium]